MNALTPLQRARRERILSTTREHLSRYGYDGLNMRALAAAARVSTTTLYNHYDSKDALVLSAITDLRQQLEQDSGHRPAVGLEFLLATSRARARQMQRAPEYARALARALFQAKPDDLITQALMRRGIDSRQAALEAMLQQGELNPNVDTRQLARDVLGGTWSTILLWSKELLADDELEQDMLRTLIQPLLTAVTPDVRAYLQQLLASGNHDGRLESRRGG